MQTKKIILTIKKKIFAFYLRLIVAVIVKIKVGMGAVSDSQKFGKEPEAHLSSKILTTNSIPKPIDRSVSPNDTSQQ